MVHPDADSFNNSTFEAVMNAVGAKHRIGSPRQDKFNRVVAGQSMKQVTLNGLPQNSDELKVYRQRVERDISGKGVPPSEIPGASVTALRTMCEQVLDKGLSQQTRARALVCGKAVEQELAAEGQQAGVPKAAGAAGYHGPTQTISFGDVPLETTEPEPLAGDPNWSRQPGGPEAGTPVFKYVGPQMGG